MLVMMLNMIYLICIQGISLNRARKPTATTSAQSKLTIFLIAKAGATNISTPKAGHTDATIQARWPSTEVMTPFRDSFSRMRRYAQDVP